MQLSYDLIQKQTLALTPMMRQSLQVLQMSQLDLYEMVTEELTNNPLLEEDEAPREIPPEMQPISISELQKNVLMPEEWRTDSRSEGDEVSPLNFAHKEQNFTDMLHEQIRTYELPPATEVLTHYLVDSLDQRGYLTQNTAEIAEILSVPHFEVMQALYFLQSLSPIGVGARSLEECLTLQLAQSRDFNAYTLQIINSGLRLLAQNKIAAIAEMLHQEEDATRRYCNVIRSLNPIPSNGYASQELPQYIIPDAFVDCTDSGLSLRLNSSMVPHITINRTYADMLNTMPKGPERKYIASCLDKADTLLKNIEDRNKTLQRVILCIFQLQTRFFTEGRGLVPMTMNDIANRLDLNVSTISRTVQNKYIVCRRGTVSLRSLFTSGYSDANGNSIAPDMVKDRLKAFIAAEDPACPLSDDALRAALQNVNIHVARRTVAKYREALGIPAMAQRRR